MPDGGAFVACTLRVRGTVQGVGFRPFVHRLALQHALAGWVRNVDDGVAIHAEGPKAQVDAFVTAVRSQAPPAATIAGLDVTWGLAGDHHGFVILESGVGNQATTRISPDLAPCGACLRELLDPADARYGYPYINCTNCGPRYSIITGLPYDRVATTMRGWDMDDRCRGEYLDPTNRRFHAQPLACPACGPHYTLRHDGETTEADGRVIERAVTCLLAGRILAVKGVGGYHLACDARNADAVLALRDRKFRKEKPFALMVRDLEVAARVASLTRADVALLESVARPIVLVAARERLEGVAPDSTELGLLLPYAPLHHLLFAAGAPDLLVMTSANRSDEPIAYADADALDRLTGLADAFLVGARPIARRVEDSIARTGHDGPRLLRRGRGYSPGVCATLPTTAPILALGGDLKNAITLVVDGQAFVSQHIGDLHDAASRRAFLETIDDLLTMYRVDRGDLTVAADLHPGYASTQMASTLGAARTVLVQHHRAHIASVLAERQALETPVIGISFDGAGFGDDGAVWGGEFLAGSVADGFERVAHLRPATLIGGDGAARHPVQAAAGFLTQLTGLPDLSDAPFSFPARWHQALRVLEAGTRQYPTTSMGRLFDTAAALLGFTRPMSWEGQAAAWLEHLARSSAAVAPYPFPIEGDSLDFRPLLQSIIDDRRHRRPRADIARAFHAGVAAGTCAMAAQQGRSRGITRVVASGGVFQNVLLAGELRARLAEAGYDLWVNQAVPPNDGGVSLGQAALVACSLRRPPRA